VVPTIISLAGLVFDILGAFILGVEAIGPDRVQQWGLSVKTYLTDERRERAIPLVTLILLNAIVWTGIILTAEPTYPVWWDNLVIDILLAAVGSSLILTGLAFACAKLGAFLLDIQSRVRRRAAGLLGFAFLGTGFVFQFTGTLWQALQNSN
jgi:hypothetical protein